MIRFVLLILALILVLALAASAISRAAASPVPGMARCGAKEALRVQHNIIVAVRRPPYCVEV